MNSTWFFIYNLGAPFLVSTSHCQSNKGAPRGHRLAMQPGQTNQPQPLIYGGVYQLCSFLPSSQEKERARDFIWEQTPLRTTYVQMLLKNERHKRSLCVEEVGQEQSERGSKPRPKVWGFLVHRACLRDAWMLKGWVQFHYNKKRVFIC